MTDKAPPARDDDSPAPDEQSIQTGVLDTPGTGLGHSEGLRSDSGPGETPVDVDAANPFAGADADAPPGDAGTGADPMGT